MIENKIVRQSLVDAVEATKAVAAAIKNKDFDRAMQLRDAEFAEYWHAYRTTTSVDQPELQIQDEAKVGDSLAVDCRRA